MKLASSAASEGQRLDAVFGAAFGEVVFEAVAGERDGFVEVTPSFPVVELAGGRRLPIGDGLGLDRDGGPACSQSLGCRRKLEPLGFTIRRRAASLDRLP
jgi:hypothetical protein